MPTSTCPLFSFECLASLLSLAANLATFLGVPFALFVWWRDRRNVRETRENNTYQALQQQYQEFLRLCFDNVGIGMAPYSRIVHRELSPDEQAQRRIGFEILVSMLEHAYFLYNRDHNKLFQARQWSGWNQYMTYWAGEEPFQSAWKEHLREGFDTDFVKHMDALIASAHSGA